MQLSIILVNYRSAQLVKDCLASLYMQPSQIRYEVIVVDNFSGDDSITQIHNSFPQARIIEMNYNSGFARANNRGINESTGDAVLLLNSDTIIQANAVERCYQALTASEFVAAGIQLQNPDHTPQISGNYFMKGSLNNLLPLPYLGKLYKFIASVFKVKKPNLPNATGTMEVDWINGAFFMVKRSAIEKAGMLDEDFFLYAEEAEWCSRLKKVGKLCIFGNINIIHLQGETANETFGSESKGYQNLFDRKGLQIMVSNFVRIRKQFGTGWFIFHLLNYTAAIPVFFIASFFKNLFSLKNPFKEFGLASAFSKNVFKLWKLSEKIISNKPYFYKLL